MSENDEIYEKYIELINILLESKGFFPINKYNKYLVVNELKKNKVKMTVVFIRLNNRINQLKKEGKKVVNIDGHIKYMNFKNKSAPLDTNDMKSELDDVIEFLNNEIMNSKAE